MNKQVYSPKVFDNIFLLLGSNLNDRENMLARARSRLESYAIEITSQSGLYETDAWGNTNQPPFLNQALQVRAAFNPEELLKITREIESDLGRIRYERWGPRCIDIDILYWDQRIITKPDLKIPHPEIHNRRFALTPLHELAPDFRHPVLNLTNAALLRSCADPLPVRRL